MMQNKKLWPKKLKMMQNRWRRARRTLPAVTRISTRSSSMQKPSFSSTRFTTTTSPSFEKVVNFGTFGFQFFSGEFDFWLTSPKNQSLVLDTLPTQYLKSPTQHFHSLLDASTQIFLKGLTARMDSWPTLVLGTSLGTIWHLAGYLCWQPLKYRIASWIGSPADPEAVNVAWYQLLGSSYFARCIKIPLSKVKIPRHFGLRKDN